MAVSQKNFDEAVKILTEKLDAVIRSQRDISKSIQSLTGEIATPKKECLRSRYKNWPTGKGVGGSKIKVWSTGESGTGKWCQGPQIEFANSWHAYWEAVSNSWRKCEQICICYNRDKRPHSDYEVLPHARWFR